MRIKATEEVQIEAIEEEVGAEIKIANQFAKFVAN